MADGLTLILASDNSQEDGVGTDVGVEWALGQIKDWWSGNSDGGGDTDIGAHDNNLNFQVYIDMSSGGGSQPDGMSGNNNGSNNGNGTEPPPPPPNTPH
jgi:hypothetical protein